MAVLLIALSAVMYWAGTNAVVPPALPGQDHPETTYRVEIGTVEQSVRIGVTASWPTAQTLPAGTDGVVTSVSQQSGSLTDSGQVIASVNLEPVVVVTGTVPMFRTLEKGVSGPDVAQWQSLLRARGLLHGLANGTFDAATAAATRQFRQSVGASDSASVGPGSVLFVSSLPARLVVLPRVGDRLTAGADFVRVLAAAPSFVASVSGSQRPDLRSGMPVTIQAPGNGTWSGTLGSFEPQADGSYSVAIAGSLCGADCGSIGVMGQTALSASIELVPQTTGVVVPTSALTQQPSGDLVVTLSDGTAQPVRIVAEADGFAVVEGLEAGTVIRLPAPPAA